MWIRTANGLIKHSDIKRFYIFFATNDNNLPKCYFVRARLEDNGEITLATFYTIEDAQNYLDDLLEKLNS